MLKGRTWLFVSCLIALMHGHPAVPAQTNQPGKTAAATGLEDYVVVFKRRGPKFATEKTPPEHWVHLKQLAEAGKVVALGPLTDDGEIRGVSIFRVSSVEEARALAGEDPAVKIGRFTVEAYRWQGPRGIGASFASMARKTKNLPDLPMTTYYVGILTAAPGQPGDDAPEGRRLRLAHWEYVRRLSGTRQISAAGPLLGDSRLRGLVVFQVNSKADAEALAAGDPAVKAGMTMALHPWMAASGLLPQTWRAPALKIN